MATPVEDVKARLDAVEYIGRDLRLLRAGRNWKARCPFHEEKTPSFFVFPDRGSFKCFGCGAGGDLLTYVMRRDRVEFPDALRELGREAGIEVGAAAADPGRRRRRDKLLGVLASARDFLHRQLLESPEAAPARDYLRARGLAAASVERFALGWAAARGSPLLGRLRAQGFALEDIDTSGLTRADDRGVRDYLFDRLIFPIWDRTGAVVGFGGRTLRDVEPKYLNTRDSEVFTKGHLLYGFHLARDAVRAAGTAVIVEGYMDAIAAHEAGFANTVASMGTSLTPQQARMLTTSGAMRIVIALDADAAGAAAARRGLDVVRGQAVYESGTNVDLRGLVRHEDRLATDIGIAELPQGEDPDSLVRASPDRWRELIQSPTPLADFAFRWAAQEHDLDSLRGRRAAMRELLPIVAEIRDEVVRGHYFERLSRASGVPVDELRRLASRSGRRGAPRAAANQPPPDQPAASGDLPLDPLEEELLTCAARADASAVDLVGRLDPALLRDPAAQHLLRRIVQEAADHRAIDWERVHAELDPASQRCLTAVRTAADQIGDGAIDVHVKLQELTLRLRGRRIDAEIEEARLAAGGGAESDQQIAARLNALWNERLSVAGAMQEHLGTRPLTPH